MKKYHELLEFDPLARTGTYYLRDIYGDMFFVVTYPCPSYYDLWDSLMLWTRS